MTIDKIIYLIICLKISDDNLSMIVIINCNDNRETFHLNYSYLSLDIS